MSSLKARNGLLVRKIFVPVALFLRILTQNFCSAEWWTQHKTIPTVEKILALLNMPTHTLKKDEHAEDRAILLWYFDRFLPVAAGKEYYGEDIRYYKRPTEKMNVNGAQKVCVTITSEAFGLLVLENCHDKWINIFEFKKENGSAVDIPTKGDAALPFKAKWTDSKCGRVKFGGWDPKAYAFFEEVKEKIKTFRTNDASNGFDTQNYALKIMREKHNIAQEAPGRKRKRSKKDKQVPVVVTRKITRTDE